MFLHASSPTPPAIIEPERVKGIKLSLTQDELRCGLTRVVNGIRDAPPRPPPPAKPKDRYFAVTVPGPHNYVQCLYQDGDSWMLCEAASGRWNKGPLTVSGEQIRTLAVLGYNTEIKELDGNFQSAFATRTAEQRETVAKRAVETLWQVFVPDGQAEVEAEIEAPMVDEQLAELFIHPCQPPER